MPAPSVLPPHCHAHIWPVARGVPDETGLVCDRMPVCHWLDACRNRRLPYATCELLGREEAVKLDIGHVHEEAGLVDALLSPAAKAGAFLDSKRLVEAGIDGLVGADQPQQLRSRDKSEAFGSDRVARYAILALRTLQQVGLVILAIERRLAHAKRRVLTYGKSENKVQLSYASTTRSLVVKTCNLSKPLGKLEPTSSETIIRDKMRI